MLKKIILKLVTDKRFWKVLGAIILFLAFIFLVPGGSLNSMTMNPLTEEQEQAAMDALMQDEEISEIIERGSKIRPFFSSAGIGVYAPKAELIYIMFLSDQATSNSFLQRYSECFMGTSNADISSRLRDVFGVDIPIEFLEASYADAQQNKIIEFDNPGTKNNKDFIKFLRAIYDDYWGSFEGTCGTVLTEEFLANLDEQQVEVYANYRTVVNENLIGFRCVDDVGMAKAYLSLEAGTWNIVPDENCDWADGQAMLDAILDEAESREEAGEDVGPVSGAMDSFPHTPGVALLTEDGQVHYYVGGWQVFLAGTPKEGLALVDFYYWNYTKWFCIPGMVYE